MTEQRISLLFPYQSKNAGDAQPQDPDPVYRGLSHETIHDLGIDTICTQLSNLEAERTYILHVMTHMTPDPRVAAYRADVFEDIYDHPELRERIVKILDRINFLKDYGGFKRDYDDGGASMFELMHRLEEINDYIICVEAIHECLEGSDIHSDGLRDLKRHVDEIYADRAFAEMREDIGALRADTSNLKSVTLGVNLNERFEAESIGLISVNNKKFTKSNVIGNFSDAITARRGGVHEGNEWDENYRYQPFTASAADISESMARLGSLKIAASSPLGFLTMASIPAGDYTSDMTRYMDRIVNHMLFLTVRKLKEVLSRYVNITITEITDLIPEFMYYIRWAEYLKRLTEAGYAFRKPRVTEGGRTEAHGFYNLHLARAHLGEDFKIVPNNLSFDRDHATYILTGANRGGKTTVTVATGLMFVLAQGGIYIPGSFFEYVPVDCIYTHFPADEDQTMDLGRLGEECKRFREIYTSATDLSLLLLNETFSTTSFEEGYHIARDAVKAILTRGCRTIYNTHMHKLAHDIDEINAEVAQTIGTADGDPAGLSCARAASLIVRTDAGKRSFVIAVAPPEGMSYAGDIARKYGVTYELLTHPYELEAVEASEADV